MCICIWCTSLTHSLFSSPIHSLHGNPIWSTFNNFTDVKQNAFALFVLYCASFHSNRRGFFGLNRSEMPQKPLRFQSLCNFIFYNVILSQLSSQFASCLPHSVAFDWMWNLRYALKSNERVYVRCTAFHFPNGTYVCVSYMKIQSEEVLVSLIKTIQTSLLSSNIIFEQKFSNFYLYV